MRRLVFPCSLLVSTLLLAPALEQEEEEPGRRLTAEIGSLQIEDLLSVDLKEFSDEARAAALVDLSDFTTFGSDPQRFAEAAAFLGEPLPGEDLDEESQRAIRELAELNAELGPSSFSLPDDARVEKIIGDADRAAAGLLRNGLRRAEGFDSKYEWAAASAGKEKRVGAEIRDVGLRPWLLQLARGHITDQTDLGLRSSLDIAVLGQLGSLSRSVVAIYDIPPGSEPCHIGTGFSYGGRVVTAAHVVAPIARQSDNTLDYARIRVVFADTNGVFDPESPLALTIDPITTQLYATWDSAILGVDLRAKNNALRAALIQRLQGIPDGQLQDSDLRRGTTFLLTSQDIRGEIRLTYVQPGPIVLPAQVEVGLLDDLDIDAGPGFLRAFRFEVIAYAFDRDLLRAIGGLGDLPRLAFDALTNVELESPGYGSSAPPATTSRRLQFVPSHHVLLRNLLPEPRPRRLLVEVFGSDLETIATMSGSPVFLSKSRQPRLAGIHTAGTSNEAARAVLPHSRDVALAVPFHRVRDTLTGQ
ncbi:MAG: hypothetical protein AAGB93_08145 [Planctomycetota bacterium]